MFIMLNNISVYNYLGLESCCNIFHIFKIFLRNLILTFIKNYKIFGLVIEKI